jgi:trans-aconitate methyltransferase
MKGIIYWNVYFYKFIIYLIYKRNYRRRDEIISEQTDDLKVLDLCCGYGSLSRYIKKYRGIDFNKPFVNYARKKGLDVSFGDIAKIDLPEEECIILQASLYHFIPEHKNLIEKIIKKAEKKL